MERELKQLLKAYELSIENPTVYNLVSLNTDVGICKWLKINFGIERYNEIISELKKDLKKPLPYNDQYWFISAVTNGKEVHIQGLTLRKELIERTIKRLYSEKISSRNLETSIG